MYTGDFTNWVTSLNGATVRVPIYDPTTQVRNADGTYTRTAFPGNIIPPSKFDPVSVKALSAYQSGGLTLAPNNGAAPGTVGYVRNNLPRLQWLRSSSEYEGQHQGRPHVQRSPPHVGLLRLQPFLSGAEPCRRRHASRQLRKLQRHARNSDVVRWSWDWTLSPTRLNHFYAGGNNWRENHDPPQSTIKSGAHWKDKVCLATFPIAIRTFSSCISAT